MIRLQIYEMAFFIIALILILVIVGRCCRLGYICFDRMHSFASIAFDTDEVTVYVDWVALPDGGRNYRLVTPITSMPKFYSFYFFGIMTLDTNGWSIMDTTTGHYLKIPTWSFIGSIATRKLVKRVLPTEHTVAVAVIHSHTIEYPPQHRDYEVQGRTPSSGLSPLVNTTIV